MQQSDWGRERGGEGGRKEGEEEEERSRPLPVLMSVVYHDDTWVK